MNKKDNVLYGYKCNSCLKTFYLEEQINFPDCPHCIGDGQYQEKLVSINKKIS